MDTGAKNYEQFLKGDDCGLENIIKEYHYSLALFLTGIVKNSTVAEDLAEDTFVLLCTKKPRFNQKASFKTWLFTIARNLAVDYLRKNKTVTFLSIEDYEKYAVPSDELLQKVEGKLQMSVLYETMFQLKDEYLQILYLTYFEGLSNKEAAKILKKSVHNIEVLLSRARAALKKKLMEKGFVYEN